MKLTKKTLLELKAKALPHCTAADIGITIKPELEGDQRVNAETQLRKVDEYLRIFTPMNDSKCILCGSQQGGNNVVDGFLNARFTWGIAHGEGFCSVCGYPGRATHYLDKITLPRLILQYHPDELKT